MSDFYTTTFTSKDAPDEDGVRAEVFVIVGRGVVEKIVESKAGKSVNVKFNTDNREGYTTTGWLPKDEKAYDKVKEAYENQEPLDFRVELSRKKEKDRTTPIRELRGINEVTGKADMTISNENISRNVVAVKGDDDDAWITQRYIRTNMLEDPKNTEGVYSAAEMSLEELQGLNQPKHTSGVTIINPVNIHLELYFYVLNYVEEHNLLEITKDMDEKKAGGKKRKHLRQQSTRLFHIANRIQKGISGVEQPDPTNPSHEDARTLMFNVIKHLLPMDNTTFTDDETYKEWEKNVIKTSVMMWKWSQEELNNMQ